MLQISNNCCEGICQQNFDYWVISLHGYLDLEYVAFLGCLLAVRVHRQSQGQQSPRDPQKNSLRCDPNVGP